MELADCHRSEQQRVCLCVCKRRPGRGLEPVSVNLCECALGRERELLQVGQQAVWGQHSLKNSDTLLKHSYAHTKLARRPCSVWEVRLVLLEVRERKRVGDGLLNLQQKAQGGGQKRVVLSCSWAAVFSFKVLPASFSSASFVFSGGNQANRLLRERWRNKWQDFSQSFARTEESSAV